jgi:N-acetylmuramoyl-L-alanine amidase
MLPATLVLGLGVLAAPAPACTRIVVDPGHDLRANLATEPIGPGSRRRKIKDGGGAPGEARVNLAIGLELRRLLVRRGYCVTMTRDRMRGTSIGNVARARLANRVRAKLWVRIHADGVDNSSSNGTSTLYPAFIRGWTDDILPASKSAARKIEEEVVRSLGSRNLGLSRRSDLTGFNWSDVPVVLVEVGFLSNPRENRLLNSARYQRRAALGMANGIGRFVRP